MILGMSTATFTFLHVLISLVGIGSGLIVMFGFGSPIDHLLPSHILGIISLLVLAIAIAARYVFHLAGG